MSEERRRQRKEIRLLQQESVWLQKALFALQRAEDTRERLADTRDEEPGPYTFAVEDEELSAQTLHDALQDQIQDLLDTVRVMRQNLR